MHHSPEQCFSKPVNFKKHDEWIAKKEAERSGASNPKSTSVVGMKEITAPSAPVAVGSEPFISPNCEFDEMNDVNVEFENPWTGEIEASPSIYDDNLAAMVSKLPEMKVWGLLDTGATHHTFKTLDMFVKDTIKPLADTNKQLTLAGGKSSLEVKSKGNMRLKAGDDSMFELKECLYIPELGRKLIAGGILLRKGVEIHINPNNSSCFSLVLNNEALFNGTFLSNNLMLVEIIPVSATSHSQQIKANHLHVDSGLLHKRLGHLSDRYLRMMCKNGCMDDIEGVEVNKVNCNICSVSKLTKLPHNQS